MKSTDPLKKTKKQYQYVIDKIKIKESEVGIDAQYTHAIVIEYLKGLTQSIDRIEKRIAAIASGKSKGGGG